ncbi:MAG: hypothetical protein J2P59_03030 [Acidimicrobiales bacterium]|nr:hypothetical protein [Acidimicrobiales bacterium]
MSSVTGSPGGGSVTATPGTQQVSSPGANEADPTLPPGQRRRPRPRRSLLHDLESLVPFIIAVAVLITIVVGLVLTVRPHPNTNGTVYDNTYGVFSNNS